MKTLKSVLAFSIILLTFLLAFYLTYLLLIKYGSSFLGKLGAPVPLAEKFSGSVVYAYPQAGNFHFKVKSWNIETKVDDFKDFVSDQSLVIRNSYFEQATPGAALTNSLADLKVGDQIEVSYRETSGVNQVSAITRTSTTPEGQGVIFGQVTKTTADDLQVSIFGQTFTFIIDGVVKIGPKFNDIGSGDETSSRPGTLKEFKDFSSLKSGENVQVLYSGSMGPLLIAQSVLILD